MLYSQHFTFHWKLLVFCQNSAKLTSTIHPIRCAVALGTSTCCQLKVVLPSKRKGLLQHTVYQKVSALARLAFYLLILKETSVRSRRGWGGGGTSGNSWCECTARFSKSWTYFRSKNVIFHTFSDLASKIYTYLQTWPLRNYVTDT